MASRMAGSKAKPKSKKTFVTAVHAINFAGRLTRAASPRKRAEDSARKRTFNFVYSQAVSKAVQRYSIDETCARYCEGCELPSMPRKKQPKMASSWNVKPEVKIEKLPDIYKDMVFIRDLKLQREEMRLSPLHSSWPESVFERRMTKSSSKDNRMPFLPALILKTHRKVGKTT